MYPSFKHGCSGFVNVIQYICETINDVFQESPGILVSSFTDLATSAVIPELEPSTAPLSE